MSEGDIVEVKKFRLAGKCFFLTWPKNDSVGQVVLDRIVLYWSDKLSFAVVAEELHKDGDRHLHAIIGFKTRADLKDANPLLDSFTGKHGNYQAAKSATKVLRYVCKDGHYVTFGEVPDFATQPGKMDEVALMCDAGASLKEIFKKHPGFVLAQVGS